MSVTYTCKGIPTYSSVSFPAVSQILFPPHCRVSVFTKMWKIIRTENVPLPCKKGHSQPESLSWKRFNRILLGFFLFFLPTFPDTWFLPFYHPSSFGKKQQLYCIVIYQNEIWTSIIWWQSPPFTMFTLFVWRTYSTNVELNSTCSPATLQWTWLAL